MCNRVANSEWKFATNSTEYNRRRMKEQQSLATKFECVSWKRATEFDIHKIAETNVQRQLSRIIKQGRCGLSEERYNELTHVITLMKDTYNNAKICPFRGDNFTVLSQIKETPMSNSENKLENYVTGYTGYCDLKLDPDLIRIIETGRNERELRYVWNEWRSKVGPPMRNTFMRYIDLANQAAQIHG